MSKIRFEYPANVIKAGEGYIVTFPDFPDSLLPWESWEIFIERSTEFALLPKSRTKRTQTIREKKALTHSANDLTEIIVPLLLDGKDIPPPSKADGRPTVVICDLYIEHHLSQMHDMMRSKCGLPPRLGMCSKMEHVE